MGVATASSRLSVGLGVAFGVCGWAEAALMSAASANPSTFVGRRGGRGNAHEAHPCIFPGVALIRITYYVLLTTYYVLLTMYYYVLLTVRYLLCTIHYLLLTTYYLLLTTYYLLCTAYCVLLTVCYSVYCLLCAACCVLLAACYLLPTLSLIHI